MNCRILFSLLAVYFAIVVASCNDDVFIEDNKISTKDIVIEGDDGMATVHIPTADLLHIYFKDSNSQDFWYYDAVGNEIQADSPAAEVGRIVYDNPLISFELVKDGNILTFFSYENPTGSDFDIDLCLEYTYAVETIHLKILQGEPLFFLTYQYKMDDAEVDESTSSTVKAVTFNNGSSLEQTLTIYPFENEFSSATISPVVSLWRGIEVSIALPANFNGNWYPAESYDIVLGESISYSPPYTKYDVSYVPVPAHTSVRAVTTVSYSTIKVPLELHFVKPVSGRDIYVSCVCTVSEPVSYEVTTEKL